MDRMPASSSAPLAKSASGRLPYVWTTISLMSCIAVLYARDERERSVGPLSFHLAAFRFIICSMADPDPLAGIVPRAVHPVNDGETTRNDACKWIGIRHGTYYRSEERRVGKECRS